VANCVTALAAAVESVQTIANPRSTTNIGVTTTPLPPSSRGGGRFQREQDEQSVYRWLDTQYAAVDATFRV